MSWMDTDKKSGLVTEEGLDYRQYHPKVRVYTECHNSSLNKGERRTSQLGLSQSNNSFNWLILTTIFSSLNIGALFFGVLEIFSYHSVALQ